MMATSQGSPWMARPGQGPRLSSVFADPSLQTAKFAGNFAPGQLPVESGGLGGLGFGSQLGFEISTGISISAQIWTDLRSQLRFCRVRLAVLGGGFNSAAQSGGLTRKTARRGAVGGVLRCGPRFRSSA